MRIIAATALLALSFLAPLASAQTTRELLDRDLRQRRNDAQLGHQALLTPCPAKPITPPVVINGKIDSSSCIDEIGLREDVYSVFVRKGQTIDIQMLSSDFEVFLYIGLGNGTSIPVDHISVDGLSISEATFTFTSDGTYLIEAESLYSRAPQSSPWSGNYKLTVSLSAGDPPTTTKYAHVVPIVGHLTGAGGSEFRSDLKLHNTHWSAPVTGRLAFTPRGQVPSATDPQIAFTVPPRSVVFYEDVYNVGYPGGSGAARLTVYGDTNPLSLQVDTSTYTAVPGGGELGQSPTVYTDKDWWVPGYTRTGIVGKASERTNVFIVTAERETTLRFRYVDPNGVQISQWTRTFFKDSTHQLALADLVAPAAVIPNATLEVYVDQGRARVAFSPVNNVSNQGRWQDFK